MTATLGKDVLRRKASVGRASHEARAMTPAKALRLAIEKAADAKMGLAMSVTGGSRGPSDLSEVLDAMTEDGLLLLLDGPDGRVGALCLDFALLSGLVEMQTVGKVLPRDPDPRPTTRTDAAIVTPLVDDVLARFAIDLAPEEEGFWAAGYRVGGRCPDLRVLGLALGAPEYQLLRVPVDIARGSRAGQLMLALPNVTRPPPAPDPSNASAEQALDMAARLRARLLDVPATLEAVLCRLTLPLAQVRALAVGDLLTLPADAVYTARLETGPKRAIALAQMGQMNGRRALRLHPPGGPEAAGDGTSADQPATDRRQAASPALIPSAGIDAAAALSSDVPDLSEFDLPADLLEDFDDNMPPV